MNRDCLIVHRIVCLLFGGSMLMSCTSTTNNNNFYNYKVEHKQIHLKSAVSSAHPLASQAGVWAMQEGGNAYDAAVTTQLALAVVFPAAGNIGGGGFLVSRDKDGTVRMLDFRERAPLAARENMFIKPDGSVSIAKQYGWLAAGIPGTIDGIYNILPFCKLGPDKLFQPAIALAKYGFAITKSMADDLNRIQVELKHYNSEGYCPFIKASWREGDTLRQEKLAATLERILNKGRDEFYTGKTAKLIIAQSQHQGGIIQVEDLKKYASIWREPIQFHYKNYTMIVPPLPSSGGILLAQMFTMLAPYTSKIDFSKPTIQTIQTMIEVEARAFADRTKYMGDPAFYKAPQKEMLDSSYIMSKINGFFPGQKKKASLSIFLPPIIQNESEETTHISIVDKEGNAVSVTTTLNGWYGSLVYVNEAGFFMNDEMDDFSAKPGSANMYGAVEGLPNKVQPGKTMLSSMTPTIVLKEGKLKYVVGSPGGTTIPTSVFQTLINLIEYNLSSEEAVFSARFHHQYLPDSVVVEKRFSENWIKELQRLGYSINRRERTIGRVDLIEVADNGFLNAVGDYRGDDSPDGER